MLYYFFEWLERMRILEEEANSNDPRLRACSCLSQIMSPCEYKEGGGGGRPKILPLCNVLFTIERWPLHYL